MFPWRSMQVLRLFVLAAAALSLVRADAAQFRSSTELVSVYATVQDRDTRLVPDLTQDDFIITDNGKVQPITFFSNEVTPFSVIVMLDRSGSMYQHQYVLRDAAMAFIVRLMPTDQARIGSFGDFFGNRVVISPSRFTSNKADLIDVLRVPIGIGGRSPIWISIDQSITALSVLDGRRVVLIFSDGHDDPLPTLVPVKVKDLIERARLTNVMVYALAFTDIERRPGRSPKVTPPDPGLRKLADDSGGGYFEVTDTDKLGALFTRVAEELHRQYWLGFAPPARDGKVHKIVVKVKQKDMTVRARQSYVAPAGR
jgi:Ca-activated chloride channel family protein